MRILFFGILLLVTISMSGCQYPQKRIGIIHDYMFQNATKICIQHDGLHYIITNTIIKSKSSNRDGYGNDYPCEDIYLVRCQDGTLIKQYTGAVWCVISELQIEESSTL